ncbi:hypothetical protein [Pseudidiomarina sp.]|uniref:hypothetical protein n=1 Tax=Pseudidiomarina sp. TaxID=2081707 RepID=UPI00299F4286|nr:hypothetical protein [Pseudidiomarina sp.]MDX1706865.1 hypothetical protein [Pseudidiomarina sp.]
MRSALRYILTLSTTSLACASLMLTAAAAQPFTRILWYNIEAESALVPSGDAIAQRSGDAGEVFHLEQGEQALFDMPASRWWRIRVYHSDAAVGETLTAGEVWSSAGDGVFISHAPKQISKHDDFSDYFYQPEVTGARVLMLQNNSTANLRITLHHAVYEDLPEHEQHSHIQLLPGYETTALTRETGFEAHDFQPVRATEIYSREFDEPGLYHLEIKVPWQSAYDLHEPITLRSGDKTFQLAAQLDTTTAYPGIGLLSRSMLVPFYVAEADQQIAVDLDRQAYVRWLQTDADEQFLFSRNSPGPIDQARQRQLADEPLPPVTTTFFRSLPPARALATEAVIGLTGGIAKPRPTFLPQPEGPPLDPDYLYQLGGNDQVTFQVPRQTQSPPVRATLKRPDAQVWLTLRSSAGEKRFIRYLPDFKVAKHWQLDNPSLQAITATPELPPQLVTRFMLAFSQPFDSIQVQNNSDHPAWLRLDYQNESRVAPAEQLWLNSAGEPFNTVLLKALISGDAAAVPDNALSYEVTGQWRPRIEARARQFAERYPSQQISGQRNLGPASFAAIRGSLASAFQVELTNLHDVYHFMMSQGFNFTARQLLVDFAAGPPTALQAEAEHLLLQVFTTEERWFDVEGYWAWRLVNRAERRALAGIARSWAYQNRYRESAQLFWLLEQNGELTTHLRDAARAAALSQQYELFEHWQTQLPASAPTVNTDPDEPGWVKLQPAFTGVTRQALIYNRDLQQYLSTFYLPENQAVDTRIQHGKRLKLTLYPVLTEIPEQGSDAVPAKAFDVTINGQRHRFAIRLDRASDSLIWAQNSAIQVGLPQSFVLELDADQTSVVTVETPGFEAGIVMESTLGTPPATTALTLRLSELVLKHQQGEVSDAQLKRIKADTLNAVLTDEQQYLLNQLTASYAWQRLDAVGSSNGIAYLEAERWQPSSPGLQLRKALMLSPVREGERRLRNDEQAQIEVELRQPMRMTLQIRKADEVTVPAEPVQVVVNTRKGDRLLTLDGADYSLPIELERGQHIISLRFAEPSDAIVLYRLRTENNEEALPPNQIKTWRASHNQPIRLFVPANTLLRTDQYQRRDDSATHSYQWFAEDSFHQVAHAGDGEYSYYRFYIWQQQPPQPENPLLAAQAPAGALNQTPVVEIWPVPGKQSVAADTLFELDEQQDGTWGFEGGYRVRSNFDEGFRTPQEKFIDTRWNYRRHLTDWDAWWHSSVQWREHNGNGLQTLVSDNQMYWPVDKYFDLQTNLNLYYQVSADDSEAEGAWSAYGSVSGRWKYYWNNRSRNEVEVQLFARELSEEQMLAVPVDDDILTQYKLDHGYGMRISDQFTYQPWLDSRLHAGAQITLNEFGQNKLIDKWSVETGWRQYWRPWRLAFDARYTRYMNDDNRAAGLSSTLFGFSLDYELWQSRGNLWQFSFDLRHDINRNSTGAFFGISWNHTDGQGYDDFAPPSLIFAPLRQRHALKSIDSNDIVIRGTTEDPNEN